MNKELLSDISNTNTEIQDLDNRIKKLESKPTRIVIDAVRGSSKEFPYTEHNCKIEGIETPKYKKLIKSYKKMLKQKKEKLMKLNKKFEYELNYIEDSELRMILRFKYEDNMTNNQIAHKMNQLSKDKEYTEDGIRMKIKRFLKKF